MCACASRTTRHGRSILSNCNFAALSNRALPSTRSTLSLLAQLIPRDRRQIFPKFLTFPPRAGLPTLLTVCKTIAIKHRADVVGRLIRERVMRKQSGYIPRSLQQPDDQSNQPWILLGSLQSGKPHLPIKSWLVRRAPTRGAFHVTRFPFEFIRRPINAIGAAFDHYLATVLGHHAKESVAIYDSKCFQLFVELRQPPRRSALRLERAENEPGVDWKRDNNYCNCRVRCPSSRYRFRIRRAELLRRRAGGSSSLHASTDCRVIDQQEAQRDRQQIEEAIVAGERDYHLKEDHQSRSDQSRASRRPDKKWRDDLNYETKCD